MAGSSLSLPTPPRRSRLQVLGLLVAVWLLFGSALVAVRAGVHGSAAVPPFLFSGTRFLVAGAILLTWSAWRAGWRLDLRPADVAAAVAIGLGLMVGGQGAASWASQYAPAGVLAVLVTTVPVWIVILSWVFLRQRPAPPVLLGIVAGFAGVAFLASPSGGAHVPPLPALVVLGGSLT